MSNCRCLVGGRTLTVCLLFTELLVILLCVASLVVKETVIFRWKVDSCRGRVVSFPGRKESSGQGRVAGARQGLNLPV